MTATTTVDVRQRLADPDLPSRLGGLGLRAETTRSR